VRARETAEERSVLHCTNVTAGGSSPDFCTGSCLAPDSKAGVAVEADCIN